MPRPTRKTLTGWSSVRIAMQGGERDAIDQSQTINGSLTSCMTMAYAFCSFGRATDASNEQFKIPDAC